MAVASEKAVSLIKNETVNTVMSQIRSFQEQGRLQLPPGYSAQNALMSAWLVLQTVQDREKKPALQVCTKESIANSLLDMVVQGLNPMKKQCYFIVYGNQLVCQRSYHGTKAVTKSLTKCKDIFAEVVYENDTFRYRIQGGNKVVMEHLQELGNVDKGKIKAAYCTIVPGEGEAYTEIMTMDQIRQAWAQSRQSPFDDAGNLRAGSVHAKFTDEMAKKTVINRACKAFINSSNDDNLVIERMNRSDDTVEEAEFEEEVAANANRESLEAEWHEKDEEFVDADEEVKESQKGSETKKPDTQTSMPPTAKEAQKSESKTQRKDRGF